MGREEDAETIARLDNIAGGRLLIRQGEAAQALGIGRKTLIDEIEAGRLRYVIVGKGKRKRFKPSDLLAYIRAQERLCDEDIASPPGGRDDRRSTVTSACAVFDFEEALRRTTKRSPSNSPPKSGPKLSMVPAAKRPKSRSPRRSPGTGSSKANTPRRPTTSRATAGR